MEESIWFAPSLRNNGDLAKIAAHIEQWSDDEMVFDHIEKLKREYTDKYVVVDTGRPELRRFEGQTGMIKTVNMNGSALVEFDGLNNIGWFDIAIDSLKVVDKPIPKEEPKKAAKAKPAAKAAPAKAKAAAKPAAAGGKMSVAEMLAAARGEKSGAAPAPAAAAPPEPAEEAPAPEAAPAPPAEEATVAEAAPAPAGDVPTDIPGILAYCRKVDG